MQTSLSKFTTSLVVAFLATGLSYGLALAFGWIESFDLLEAVAVYTSYSCTYMCAVQTRWNYPMGALSVALLAVYFFKLELFASMALQLYLLPWLLYGWFRWKHDSITRPVVSVFAESRWWLAAYAAATVTAYGLMVYLTSAFGGQATWWDSAIFALSILAQFLMDNKKRENWAIWAGVNVISIGLYASSGAYILAIQYAFWLANAVFAWVKWTETMKAKEA